MGVVFYHAVTRFFYFDSASGESRRCYFKSEKGTNYYSRDLKRKCDIDSERLDRIFASFKMRCNIFWYFFALFRHKSFQKLACVPLILDHESSVKSSCVFSWNNKILDSTHTLLKNNLILHTITCCKRWKIPLILCN